MAYLIRQEESPVALRAGLFSVGMHALLIVVLVFSFRIKQDTTANVAQVELWDTLPSPVAKPVAKVKPPEPEVKPPPAVEPPKPVVEEKPQEEAPPKPDIALKKEPIKPVKPEKKDEKKPLAKVEETPKPEKKPEVEKKPKESPKKQDDALKKLQESLLEEDSKADVPPTDNSAAKAAQAAALKGEINQYVDRIKAKIYGNINRQLCGSGKPVIIYSLHLMATGDLNGKPKLLKTSGNQACDEAIERAILQSDPLPKPPTEIFSEVREMEIKFRPNDDV